MDLAAWLKTWVARHPLKAPSDETRARFTAEVMARVRALQSPAPAPMPVRTWLTWPRLSLAVATAAAGLFVIGRLGGPSLPQQTNLAMVLAESPSSDEAWVDDTLQLLDELEEEGSDNPSGESAAPDGGEEWLLEELQLFDESELAATS